MYKILLPIQFEKDTTIGYVRWQENTSQISSMINIAN